MPALHLTDVTLRDGLQMEPRPLSTEEKLALFRELSRCGYSRLEITSFVNPKWVPQFNDTEAFCERLFSDPGNAGRELMAFVPNERGLDRLLAYPIQWASAFIAVSETFNRKNVNASVDETLAGLKAIVAKTRASQRKLRVYISTVFGCPYEGQVDLEKVASLVEKVAALAPDELALSDTIGVAVPQQVEAVIRRCAPLFPLERTALHLHATYGLAIACAYTGYAEGIRRFDGTTGGLGGCPYAKGASGNVASEALLYAFQRQGAASMNAREIESTLRYMKTTLGFTLHSQLAEIIEKGGSWYAV